MRIGLILIISILTSLVAFGCTENGPVTILFTGDDRGWIVPAG
jgi:hypothetical protein